MSIQQRQQAYQRRCWQQLERKHPQRARPGCVCPAGSHLRSSRRRSRRARHSRQRGITGRCSRRWQSTATPLSVALTWLPSLCSRSRDADERCQRIASNQRIDGASGQSHHTVALPAMFQLVHCRRGDKLRLSLHSDHGSNTSMISSQICIFSQDN